MLLQSLREHYQGAIPHTRYVAELSLLLFDQVQKVCDIPAKARSMVEIGALLHDVAVSIDEAQHNIIGRDIVLSAALDGLDEERRAVVACMVSFHRKKVRPDQEPAYVRLGKKERQLALSLAALLRVADGLDYSHTQTTRIVSCDISDTEIVLHIAGANADENGSRALAKADLWNRVFQRQLTICSSDKLDSTVEEPDTEQEQTQIGSIERPYTIHMVLPENSVAETMRRLLRRYFQKMVAQEKGVRADKDIERVHDMRVATRRIRAILPIIEEVAPQKDVRRLRRGIRATAKALGAVRDSDVFLDQVNRSLQSLSEEERPDLSPLLQALQRDRLVARTHLLMALDSSIYADFKHRFAQFITDSASAWNTSLRVCDMAGSHIWKCYEDLRAYETRVALGESGACDDELLHAMRIAGKHLRYLLDLFGNPDARLEAVLEPLVALQNCLGSIQDIAVAKTYIAALPLSPDEQPHLDAYVASREAERERLLTELPRLWEKIMSATYRRKLMELIIKLS